MMCDTFMVMTSRDVRCGWKGNAFPEKKQRAISIFGSLICQLSKCFGARMCRSYRGEGVWNMGLRESDASEAYFKGLRKIDFACINPFVPLPHLHKIKFQDSPSRRARSWRRETTSLSA
jgi:hypothetical protein